MTQIESLVPVLCILYSGSFYLFINILVYLTLCSIVDTLFEIGCQIIPVFWSFNDDVERPSLSFGPLMMMLKDLLVFQSFIIKLFSPFVPYL